MKGLKEKRNEIQIGNELWSTTKENIEDTIMLFYDAKNILEQNNVKDAERIIKYKRNSVIRELKNVESTMCSDGTARQYDIQRHDLTAELRFLNWVLKSDDEFDRTEL